MALRFNDDYPLSSSFTFQEFVDACGSESCKERVNAAQHLSDAIRKTADFDFSMNDFFDSLEKLFDSPGEVRRTTVEKLREVFSELSVKGMPKTLTDLAHFTVNELVKTLDDGDENEHNAALSTITYLFENDFLEQADIMEALVPALFRLFFKQCQIRNRCNETQFTNMINIVAVLCFVANQIDIYPRDWAYAHFLAQFSAFFADDSCVIRKLSLSTMGALAKRFGQTFTERCLVPHLLRAINDTNSRVRIACAEVFVDISTNCSVKIRENVLAPSFLKLLEDKQRFVHMSSSSQLGPIIATFAEPRRTGLMIKDGQLESLSPKRSPKKV
uniref:Condensin complex subunit 1 n=1 Tax=Bursaphelenchus xylophilus TaxID=6326 RepID=A0A1I7RIF1_BURXY